jgi:hypothetical protein
LFAHRHANTLDHLLRRQRFAKDFDCALPARFAYHIAAWAKLGAQLSKLGGGT